MRKINYMGWAVAALLIVSCQGGTNIPGTDITPGIVDTPTVKWDAGVNTNPVLDATGGSLSVSFTSSDAWKASIINGRADWLRLSPESGNKGKGTLTIQVSPNEEYDERRATVQVKCGTAQVTLLVTQKQKDAFTASASKQEFGFEGGDLTIQVSTNIAFSSSVTAGAEWLVPVQTKGLTNHTLIYKVLANEDTQKREGAVVVSSSLGQETFKVFQQGSEPTLVLSSNQETVSADGGTFTVEVRHNVEVSMEMPKGVDWLSEVTTRAMSTDSYTFQVSANDTYESREASIRFFNEELGLSESVKVTQVQNNAILLSPDKAELSYEATVLDILLRTNVEPEMEIGVSWIQRVDTKALSEQHLFFLVEENTGSEPRVGTITFRYEDLVQTLTVTQGMQTDYSKEPGFYGMAGLTWTFVPQKMQLRMGRDAEGTTGVFTLMEPSTNRLIQIRYAPYASLKVGSTISVNLIQNVDDSRPSVQENLSFQVKSIDGPFVTLVDGEGHEAIMKQ